MIVILLRAGLPLIITRETGIIITTRASFIITSQPTKAGRLLLLVEVDKSLINLLLMVD
jgi:hypothetical protein